ncbi:hydrogen cyanide synthase subunit HcnB [Pseudovibrio japonicus]|uniref:Hydrogen cyanide synthase subunit HcnB n=1 Tax=Pseudovibrio japonicus TaxID=366534 RepID=A0ABQ3EQV9_9HYPH|nr:FAD/NAD(P)-binding oxidoreductase [Pseudovibrio japonicus]GHB45961.1 hydrogen cyanide synthase subunit HcnB [Pseudovibrio japonicus]
MTDNVVIVGAGPAGSSAAVELAKHGIQTTVIDEAPKEGGVIYRGPWRKTPDMPHLDEKLIATMDMLKQAYQTHSSFIDLQTQTRVLGPLSTNSLLISKNNELSIVEYDQLILATGCQERSVPFPGWHLPGVMLLGGIQLQLKSGLVRPGHKVVIAGTGPLLVLVACQLSKAGCDVLGVYEAAKFSDIAKEALALLNRPQQALNGLSMMWYLKKMDIPIHYGWGLVEATGDGQVNEVTVAPYDYEWTPDHSQAVTLSTDTLGVGYGFTARSQLAQLIGLDVEYDHMSGTIPKVDEWQRSSNTGVFCAGDSAKIAGADAAMIEGTIAALAVTCDRGKLDHSAAERKLIPLRRKLTRQYRFRQGFDSSGYRKMGLLTLPKNDTIICRCEKVEKQAIDAAIAQGTRDIVTLKMRTRVTMGDCQGKICSPYCYDRLKHEGFSQDQGLVRPRFPLDPIPFAAMEGE